MNWIQQFFQALQDFFSTPLGQSLIGIFTSLTTIFAYMLVIFSKTSYGKRKLAKVNADFEKLGLKVNENDKIVKDTQNQVKSEIERVRGEYEERLKLYQKDVDRMEQLLLEIAKIEPNAKIKELILNYYNQETEETNDGEREEE